MASRYGVTTWCYRKPNIYHYRSITWPHNATDSFRHFFSGYYFITKINTHLFGFHGHSWHASAAMPGKRIFIHGGFDGDMAMTDSFIFCLGKHFCFPIESNSTSKSYL